jgi:tetratricopeptide (TPR) repeat protein
MDTPDCALVDREARIVSYLAETLAADEAEAFEAHYFACDQCWRELRQGLEIRAALTPKVDTSAPVIPFVAEPAPALAARQLPWHWVSLAAAAALVLATVLTMWFRGSSSPAAETTLATAPAPAVPVPTPAPPTTPSLARTAGQAQPPSPPGGRATTPAAQPVLAVSVLASVESPPFVPLALRGPHDDAAEPFDAGMKHYVAKDYAAAIPDLRAAAGLNSKAPKVTFFLAICQLLTDELDPAVEGLQQTIALGESPYLGEAHFYLAKARLRQGRLSDARDELTRAIERGGRLEKNARQLRTQVEALIRVRDQ